MCGVTGAIIKSKDHKYWELLKTSEIRGQDGTGVTVLEHQDNEFTSYRWDCKATQVGSFPQLRRGDSVIGQNRLAIFGQGHKNDQPIVTEHSALVHNGNLYDFEPVFKQYSLKRELQVDSELIVRLIENLNGDIPEYWTEGMHAAIWHTMGIIKGNYACLLLSKQTGNIDAFAYFKPLFHYEDETGIYFFSTERIGQKVFGNVKFTQIQNKEMVCVPGMKGL